MISCRVTILACFKSFRSETVRERGMGDMRSASQILLMQSFPNTWLGKNYLNIKEKNSRFLEAQNILKELSVALF